jgi:NAD(P)H-dependent FMN reductase
MASASRHRLLCLSGSLRRDSINTALLHAARQLAPANLELSVYPDLGRLPPFTPDDDDVPPSAVLELRRAVDASDGLLIACPEYAHGVPGAFKNLLDWLVGSLEFPGKPVALLNASPRAMHAQAALTEILATMSARLIAPACLALPLLGHAAGTPAILADIELAQPLRAALAAYALALQELAPPRSGIFPL